MPAYAIPPEDPTTAALRRGKRPPRSIRPPAVSREAVQAAIRAAALRGDQAHLHAMACEAQSVAVRAALEGDRARAEHYGACALEAAVARGVVIGTAEALGAVAVELSFAPSGANVKPPEGPEVA
jgi:hypothetical protein